MQIMSIVDVEAFDRSLAINVRGVMLCYKYAARQMIKQGNGGRILGALSLHLMTCMSDMLPMSSVGAASILGKRGMICRHPTRLVSRANQS